MTGMADLRLVAAYDGCGPAGQQCVESRPRSYEATAGPLAPGTRALVKERAIPRGHYVSGPTRPRSRAPSHAEEGRRQLRATYQTLAHPIDGRVSPQGQDPTAVVGSRLVQHPTPAEEMCHQTCPA